MNEMNIANALEGYLNASRLREPSIKEKKFYLSDMGKCMRVRWLKRKGIETEVEPYVNWIFKMGDLIHGFGYKALESQGLLIEAEDYVESEHFIGRYDGTIKNNDDKKKSVFDLKSVGQYKMKKVLAGEDDEENISQLLSYTMLLQEKRKDISETAYVIYINKEPNDQIPQVFFQKEYHLTSWRVKQLKEEMDVLVNFWLKGKVPPCSCPSWMKNYNSFQPLCQTKEEDIKKILEYLKAGQKVVSTKKSVYLLDNEIKKEVLKI